MQEISGLVYYNGKFIAQNDEEGRLYEISLHTDKPYPSWKFAKSGDYEEVVHTDMDWYVLKSNGTLYRVFDMFTDSTSSQQFKLKLKGGKEFEAAFFDKRKQSIVIICKDCAYDDDKGVTSAFSFDLNTLEFNEKPVFQVSLDEISKIGKESTKRFRPSAAAVHPTENRIYVLSSINRMLVIIDFDGKVKEVHHLDHKIFRQPEGITFAPNGDMYISNEANDQSMANILKFTYHPAR
ncbi:hypothetical protein COR50_08245 [Chitinophaga caeni]|uniref:SdiA-regulated family protein n=1 Tax=Chitinophaga caeni TaxID=2029983 RepID=A0A291QTA2_9BACT|nr:SdiA-regulated domain-containing protein [Chitinophaga caeni]ATL47175.1 hypothetical protein COR50_08245 [Chitinophaga caeni]